MAATYTVMCDNCKHPESIIEWPFGVASGPVESKMPKDWSTLKIPNEWGHLREYVFCCPHCVTAWLDARVHDPRFTSDHLQ